MTKSQREPRPETHRLSRLNRELAKANARLASEVGTLRQALAKRALDFQSIVNSIPFPLAVTTPTGELEAFNKSTIDYFGLTIEEFKGRAALGMVYPDDLEQTIADQRAAYASGQSYNVESRHRRADGVYRWFNVLGLPLRDADGEILRWLHLLIDIDDRKKAEEALRERERETRSLIDGIPVGAAIERPDGVFEVVNQNLLDYFGSSLEELREWRATGAVVHPDDQQRAVAEAQERLAAGDPEDVVARLRRSDGVYRWFQVRCNPFRDKDGTVARWYIAYIDIDDLKRAEAALAASERNLQAIIDTMPALAWASRHSDGAAEFFNQHYCDYVGRSAEQLQGWGWTDAIHPADYDMLVNAWADIMAAGDVGATEARLRRHDGVYRTFLFRAAPLRDESGAIVKWYGVNTDIEDRKRAEEALRSNEHKLNLILNTIPTSIHVFGTDGSILYVNYAVLDYTGLTPADVRQEDYRVRIFHAEDLERVHEERLAALKRPVPFALEMRLRRKDGSYRWFLHRYSPLLDEQGRLDRWYVASFDIDDLKRAEAELKQTNDFFEEAQRLGRTGSFVTDMDCDEHFWSEEARRIWGFGRNDKLSVANIRARIHPDDLETFDASAAQSIQGAQSVTLDFRVIVDGATRHLRLAAHSQARAGRRSFAGTLQDVTEQKLAEAALDHARTELTHAARAMSLGVLTASIAHEGNQPLSGIVTNADTCLRLLTAVPPDIDGARETARRTIRDGNRAADIITRLRALFGKKDFATECVDLNAAASEVIKLSAQELRRNAISLSTAFDPTLPPAKGDRVQIQQVIINLLLNASDAVQRVDKPDRRIRVCTQRDGDSCVQLNVEDTGIGLPPEATKLFDAFYTTKANGMGIGLSVSKSIIERHRGRLWAASNSNGPGATFGFSIPSAGPSDQPPGVNATQDLGPL